MYVIVLSTLRPCTNIKQAESICLELGIEKLNSRIVDESAMKINLRTQILASLGCDMADEGCIQAITTSEVRTVLQVFGKGSYSGN